MDTGLTYLSLGRPAQQLDQSQPVMGFPIIFLVFSELEFPRPKCVKKKIYFRRITKMNLGNLKNDILNSDLKTKPEKELPKLCKQYDTILQTILNKHAPLLT